MPTRPTRSAAAKEKEPTSAKAAAGSLVLVWGGDEYLVAAKARELVSRMCPPAEQALGLEVIDGVVETVDEAVAVLNRCIEAITTVGFFGATKTVWLRDARFFSDTPPGKYQQVKERVAMLAEEIKRGLLEGQKLLISTPRVDRRSAFFKAVQAHGTVIEYNLPEKAYQVEEQARETLRHLLDDAKLEPTAEALDLILAKAGTDTRQLVQEVAKLSTYTGDRRKVSAQDVQDIVSSAREAAGWDLADAVGRRDLPGALRILRQLMFQKESAVGLVMGLQTRVRELMVFREALDRRWARLSGDAHWRKVDWMQGPESDHALSRLPVDPRTLNPYRAGRLADQAARTKPAELLRWHRLLVNTHERMVSSPIPAELLLEFCLIHLLAGAQRASA